MNMLEKIARGICKALGDDWEREGPNGLIEAYEPAARAAVEAMMEPSESMLKAGFGFTLQGDTASSYQAMLRAILAETPTNAPHPATD